MGGAADEFPLLSGLGLYAADIRGDGNCLFNALSDQLYGNQSQHLAIRAKIVAHMREHADDFTKFIEVPPGGGMRRNPKRKNAGAYSTPVNVSPPTADEINRAFEGYLQRMAQRGTYGGNLELSAFSAAFDMDVKIYQRDFAFFLSGETLGGTRKVAHIAYHSWEHYSSIRNLDGPHTGLPRVKVRALSSEEERLQKEKLVPTPRIVPWMIEMVKSSLPYLADNATIKKALETCPTVDDAVTKLLDAEESSSCVSSAQGSSSIEREHDSDDDALHGPNKKRDRRLSRATRSVVHDKEQRVRNTASKLPTVDASQSSSVSVASVGSCAAVDSKNASEPTTKLRANANSDAGDDSDWHPSSLQASASHSRVPSPAPRKGPSRLKINPPKAVQTPSDVQPSSRRTQQKQPGPQKRGPTARDKKDIKKTAQKAARKERAQADAAASKVADVKPVTAAGSLPILTKGKTAGPAVVTGMRTVYV